MLIKVPFASWLLVAGLLCSGARAVPGQVMTPTLVQSASHNNGPLDLPIGTAIFPFPNTAGNTIVVAVSTFSTAAEKHAVINDTQGNRYYPATGQIDWVTNNPGSSAQLFYAPNIKGGSNIVTMTLVGAPGGAGNAYNQIGVHEYSGVAPASPLDATAHAIGRTAGPNTIISSGNVTTSMDGELIFGFGNVINGPLHAGDAFTIRENFGGVSEDTVQPAGGAVAAEERDSAGNDLYGMLMAAFRPAGPSQGMDLPWQTDQSVDELEPLVVTNAAAELDTSTNVTQSWLFTYPDRDALLADGWSFVTTNGNHLPRDTERTNGDGVIAYAQTNDTFGLVMRVPCDEGDLWAGANNTTNSLFRPLATNWVSMRLSLSMNVAVDFQQVHLGIFQDDDNYVDVGLAYNSSLGGEVVTFVSETNAAPHHFYTVVNWFTGGPGTGPTTNIFLRMDQNPLNGNITGFCSLDGVAWSLVGEFGQGLINARLGVWVAGAPVPYTNGMLTCDIREVDVVTAKPPPALGYQLVNPPDGASIDGNGVINWLPGVEQGGAAYDLTTVVTDTAAGLGATNSFSVSVKAPLTITADDKTRTAGTTNPPLTASYSGFVGSDDTNVLTSPVVLSTDADINSPPGTYTITASGAAADNYTISYVSGTLTVVEPAHLSGVQVDGDNVYFTVVTLAGETYQIEYNDDLSSTNWMPLGDPITGTGGSINVTNAAGGLQQFFRLRPLP